MGEAVGFGVTVAGGVAVGISVEVAVGATPVQAVTTTRAKVTPTRVISHVFIILTPHCLILDIWSAACNRLVYGFLRSTS